MFEVENLTEIGFCTDDFETHKQKFALGV